MPADYTSNNMVDGAYAPKGVQLRELDDTDTTRQALFDGVAGAMGKYANGYEYGGVRLQLDNLRYADKERYTIEEEREHKLNDRLLHRRLKGDVKLVDAVTNEVLDKKNGITLAKVPYLTARGSFIKGGSEYGAVNQSRLLPGAYTRKRDNGLVDVHFNTRPGTGSAMHVSLDPISGQYRVKIGSADLHAYSFFKSMGVSDEDLERRWGSRLLEINKAKPSADVVHRAYRQAIPKWQRDEKLPEAEKVEAIKTALGSAQVAESILKQNLPNLYDGKKAASWQKINRALEYGDLVKEATVTGAFFPDLDADTVLDIHQSFNFDLQDAIVKSAAAFKPDFEPDEMKDTYNAMHAGVGPRLASMQKWPDHWLDDQDKSGWLEWYKNYANGRRSPTDKKQIARWDAFRRRQGALFVMNPTPRRAYALVNWAIDPIKLLPKDRRESFKKEMEDYRAKEYVKWAVRREDFSEDKAHRLLTKALRRGAPESSKSTPAGLMELAVDGYLKPEDFR